MDEKFKKICACGALAVIVYGTIPLCEKCLFDFPSHYHLPTENRSTTTSIAISGDSISGISTSATTTQPSHM